MPFYRPEQTAASRTVLDRVLAEIPDSILIGGWGTWVRLHGEMSHDIDLIVSYPELERVGALTDDLSKSNHLGGEKYRATWEGIHLDLYVAHRSRLGQRLELRVEHLVEWAEHIDGYKVLCPEAHLATKLAALLDRPNTMPGRKDRYEVVELIRRCTLDTTVLERVITAASPHDGPALASLLYEAYDYASEYRNPGAPWHKPDRKRVAEFTANPPTFER